MAAISDIRAGLATALRTISGLQVVDGGYWPDQVVPPAALPKIVGGAYEQTFGADWETKDFEIHLAVGFKAGLTNAQRAMELYLSNTGASSIRVALAADRTLGGAVRYTRIHGFRDYDSGEINGQEYLTAVIHGQVDHS